MPEEFFVNLMSRPLTRTGGFYKEVSVADGIDPTTPVKVFLDKQQGVIGIDHASNVNVPLPGVVHDPLILDFPKGDRASQEPVFWVATEQVGFVDSIKNEVKILRLDHGFLVAVLWGKVKVQAPSGEILTLTRGTESINEDAHMNSADKFFLFNNKGSYRGRRFDNYSMNVVYDGAIKQKVYSVREGSLLADEYFSARLGMSSTQFLIDGGTFDALIRKEEEAEESRRMVSMAAKEVKAKAHQRKQAASFLAQVQKLSRG